LMVVRWSMVSLFRKRLTNTNYLDKNGRLIEVHKDGCRPSHPGDGLSVNRERLCEY